MERISFRRLLNFSASENWFSWGIFLLRLQLHRFFLQFRMFARYLPPHIVCHYSEKHDISFAWGKIRGERTPRDKKKCRGKLRQQKIACLAILRSLNRGRVVPNPPPEVGKWIFSGQGLSHSLSHKEKLERKVRPRRSGNGKTKGALFKAAGGRAPEKRGPTGPRVAGCDSAGKSNKRRGNCFSIDFSALQSDWRDFPYKFLGSFFLLGHQGRGIWRRTWRTSKITDAYTTIPLLNASMKSLKRLPKKRPPVRNYPFQPGEKVMETQEKNSDLATGKSKLS